MKHIIISYDEYRLACAWDINPSYNEIRKKYLALNPKEVKVDLIKNEVTIYYETN